MSTRTLGVIMNGVTGRMGHGQHLVRPVLAVNEQGGVIFAGGERARLRPILVGRGGARPRALAEQHGIDDWTPSLAEALRDPAAEISFGAQVTRARVPAVTQAIEAGEHVHVEKPTADGLTGAPGLSRLAREAGVKNGVVQDKLFRPGLRKLKRLVAGGFFGRIPSVRGDFGHRVFEGGWQEARRPSSNYRAEDGGGVVFDRFPHGTCVLEGLSGRVVGTPKTVGNPDVPAGHPDHGFRVQRQQVPDDTVFDNAFKAQWETFVRHVTDDAPFPHDFASGARGVYVAEAGRRSSDEGRRTELEPLDDHP